jgi:hypothetical protein
MRSDAADLHPRGLAIICCWQLFPEELSDLADDAPHPFDVLGHPFIGALLDTAYAGLTAGHPQLRHLFATLFGRVAALQVHQSPQPSVVARLAADLLAAPDLPAVAPLSVALQKICSSYCPEDEELAALLGAIFGRLETADSAEFANELTKILATIIHATTELLSEDDFSQRLGSALCHLTGIAQTQAVALKCWNELSEISMDFIMPLAQNLLGTALSIVDGDCAADALLEASVFLGRLAGCEEAGALMEARASLVVPALLRLIATPPSPECDSSEAWEPHIAGKWALKQVVAALSDSALAGIAGQSGELLASSAYEHRYAGLTLLDFVLSEAESPTLLLDFLEAIISCAADDAPRVRKAALKCLNDGVFRMVLDCKDCSALPGVAEAAFRLLPHLGDSPAVAAKAADLLSLLTEVPGFAHTPEVMQALVAYAREARTAEAKEPARPILYAIDHANEAIVEAAFPAFIDLLRLAITEQPLLIADICEIMCAYYARFRGRLDIGPVTELLMQALVLPTEFAREALKPLGMGVANCPTAPIEFIPALIAALSDVRDTESCYAAAFAVSCFPPQTLVNCVSDFWPLLLAVLANDSQAAKTRRAVINALTALCKASPEMCAPELPAFRTWAAFLGGEKLEWVLSDDREEGVLLATALADAFATVLRVLKDEDTALAALGLYMQMVHADAELLGRLGPAAIMVTGALADIRRDDLLEAIARDEDAGQYIVELSGIEQVAKDAQRVLDTLGFQED